MADIEAEIVAKGLTAPRVTLAGIEANIVSEHYFTARDGVFHRLPTGHELPAALDLLTFCVLVLRNGFTVTGESACASPENFDAEVGRKIARANAANKIWPLMGYELRSKLHDAAPKAAVPYTPQDITSHELTDFGDAITFRFKDGTSHELDMRKQRDTSETLYEAAARKHTQATGGKKP